MRAGLKQFLKVTRELPAGLVSVLRHGGPAEDEHELEHTFGSHRYHERRSSGRRRASPGLVVMVCGG